MVEAGRGVGEGGRNRVVIGDGVIYTVILEQMLMTLCHR